MVWLYDLGQSETVESGEKLYASQQNKRLVNEHLMRYVLEYEMLEGRQEMLTIFKGKDKMKYLFNHTKLC